MEQLKLLEINKNDEIWFKELEEKIKTCKEKSSQAAELIKLEVEECCFKIEGQRTSLAYSEKEVNLKLRELEMKEKDYAIQEKKLAHNIETSQNASHLEELKQLVPKGSSADEMEKILELVFEK
ncbi:hypothetical protein O181_001399 [Austropuccinia psidii MF-1]|uniref:Uncharacterized protein n=1 Tax=Austropuccinia psidii MF-1 TaxID=1389203 RepID=A0A9Q3BAG0_9BASI|nr:hypothetical protein [Austropuccinia psidii MF-1]